MKVNLTDILILIFCAVALLLADRFYRIEPYKNREMFQNVIPCSVDKLGLNPKQCPSGLRCINGFCASDSIPALPKNGLPVYP